MNRPPLPEGLTLSWPENETLECACDICGTPIVYEIHRAAAGSAEFVNVKAPETALLGWQDGGPTHPDHISLLLLCSRVCLLSYRDRQRPTERMPA